VLHRDLFTNCADQVQNGRRYHSYHEGEYILVCDQLTLSACLKLTFKQPNDEREQDRLDLVSLHLLIPTTQIFNKQ
jgi:hypothetical protein